MFAVIAYLAVFFYTFTFVNWLKSSVVLCTKGTYLICAKNMWVRYLFLCRLVCLKVKSYSNIQRCVYLVCLVVRRNVPYASSNQIVKGGKRYKTLCEKWKWTSLRLHRLYKKEHHFCYVSMQCTCVYLCMGVYLLLFVKCRFIWWYGYDEMRWHS